MGPPSINQTIVARSTFRMRNAMQVAFARHSLLLRVDEIVPQQGLLMTPSAKAGVLNSDIVHAAVGDAGQRGASAECPASRRALRPPCHHRADHFSPERPSGRFASRPHGFGSLARRRGAGTTGRLPSRHFCSLGRRRVQRRVWPSTTSPLLVTRSRSASSTAACRICQGNCPRPTKPRRCRS
jgi:hypothetical protein